ncbi:MAG TPA: twin-arginine translocase subunit TatC, partial [Thioalkalivibrio sp.]|nr:twin-arginine translocase subunit TatC [Thioalkalivibrio sp.]
PNPVRARAAAAAAAGASSSGSGSAEQSADDDYRSLSDEEMDAELDRLAEEESRGWRAPDDEAKDSESGDADAGKGDAGHDDGKDKPKS